jgi:hypothetical protein
LKKKEIFAFFSFHNGKLLKKKKIPKCNYLKKRRSWRRRRVVELETPPKTPKNKHTLPGGEGV